MVGFQMFPRSHPNYVFVTKIPRMLILYFTFLKNNDNSSSNDAVVIELALYVFLSCLNVSYCFWQIVLLIYQEQATAHICTVYSIWQWSQHQMKPPTFANSFGECWIETQCRQQIPLLPRGFFCWCNHRGFLQPWNCRYTWRLLPPVQLVHIKPGGFLNEAIPLVPCFRTVLRVYIKLKNTVKIQLVGRPIRQLPID